MNVFRTHLVSIRTLVLCTALFIMQGCTRHSEAVRVEPTTLPEITTAYLLEHRIIAYEPTYHEKIIATLPYEIKTFDEDYLIYLVARLPEEQSDSVLKTKGPHYYLWLERRADNWKDFSVAYTEELGILKLSSYYSSIREGHYYKEYTVDFTLEQLDSLQDLGLTLLLVNPKNERSRITLPSSYIKAYLEMLPKSTH